MMAIRSKNGAHLRCQAFARRLVFAAVMVCWLGSFAAFLTSDVYGQQVPPWRMPAQAKANSLADPETAIRVAIRKSANVSRNIVEFRDIADVTGPKVSIEKLRSLLLGIAPASGEVTLWNLDELKSILALHGWNTDQIQWSGAVECQVGFAPTQVVHEPVATPSNAIDSRTMSETERMLSTMISSHLQAQTGANSFWRITLKLPQEHVGYMSDRRWISGVSGGKEPWTGRQQFVVQLQGPNSPSELTVEASVELPPIVAVAAGPLAKGRVLVASDLKLLRLTPAMRVVDEDCVLDARQILGRELRKSVSSGQPIKRADTGPARLIQEKDLVTIQVISGSIVAETIGRALQSGGLDEVIEVEVTDTKKRLASRVVDHGKVEVIAR